MVEARGVEPLTSTVNSSEQRDISCLCCISCCIIAVGELIKRACYLQAL